MSAPEFRRTFLLGLQLHRHFPFASFPALVPGKTLLYHLAFGQPTFSHQDHLTPFAMPGVVIPRPQPSGVRPTPPAAKPLVGSKQNAPAPTAKSLVQAPPSKSSVTTTSAIVRVPATVPAPNPFSRAPSQKLQPPRPAPRPSAPQLAATKPLPASKPAATAAKPAPASKLAADAHVLVPPRSAAPIKVSCKSTLESKLYFDSITFSSSCEGQRRCRRAFASPPGSFS
jgi:hypothetical protein